MYNSDVQEAYVVTASTGELQVPEIAGIVVGIVAVVTLVLGLLVRHHVLRSRLMADGTAGQAEATAVA